jgi:hypothetical protein
MTRMLKTRQAGHPTQQSTDQNMAALAAARWTDESRRGDHRAGPEGVARGSGRQGEAEGRGEDSAAEYDETKDFMV